MNEEDKKKYVNYLKKEYTDTKKKLQKADEFFNTNFDEKEREKWLPRYIYLTNLICWLETEIKRLGGNI